MSRGEAVRAMSLVEAAAGVLAPRDLPAPVPGPGEVRVRVRACGVCRTDLHVVDGDLAVARLPVIPGHEIVGTVDALGPGVAGLTPGQRVGIPWLGWSCGECAFCTTGRENLCPRALFTGWTRDGGYAECTVADARYVFPLPEGLGDVEYAPLLCAGLIGHRAYRMAGPGRALGIYGFGAAGHIVAQVAVHEGRQVYAFTRPGDTAAQALARSLGAVWAGGSDEAPPVALDGAIIFASHGPLVPTALGHTARGATVVCAGIHMTDLPAFPYRLLWGERVVRSVANLTRADARDFLALAPAVPVRTHVTPYPLSAANQALDDLRAGRLTGAAVLVP
jgi:propanol-preferring alcohol dehydrogenase